MAENLRISSISGALLAVYFIPAWTVIAFKIVLRRSTLSMSGRTFRWRCSSAITCSFPGSATVRVALLLALGRMTVVAFLAVFLVFITRASTRRSGGCNEALGMALAIGSVMSFAGVLMASQAAETAALRLHAAELLMMLGTVIVMLIERPAQPLADDSLHAERRAVCSAASV